MHDSITVATSEDIAALQQQFDDHETANEYAFSDLESRLDGTESRIDDVEYQIENSFAEIYRVEELESVVADLTDELKSALDTIENLRFLVVNTESRLAHLEQTARRRFTFRRRVK